MTTTTTKQRYQFRVIKSDFLEDVGCYSCKAEIIVEMIMEELQNPTYINNHITFQDICNGKRYFVSDYEDSYTYINVEFIQDYESKKLNQYIAYIDFIVRKKF